MVEQGSLATAPEATRLKVQLRAFAPWHLGGLCNLLALSVIALEGVYLVMGSPSHSKFWEGATVYMEVSVASWVVLVLFAAGRLLVSKRAHRTTHDPEGA